MNDTKPRPPKTTVTPEQILYRLEWKVIRRLDGLLQGDYRTLFYGDGLDFADLREYQIGDDIRHIDWNVTARMNSLHVRQYIEDREITAWFLIDLSPSMNFGPLDRPKKQVLIDLVATLCRLLTRNGNRVGAILYNNQIYRTISPKGGRIQVLRLIQELLNETKSPTKTSTDLSVLVNAGLNMIKKHTLVFVISDFISTSGWTKPLSLLSRKNEMIGIRLWDPREVELPDLGLIFVEDAETGEQLRVDSSNPEFRRRFFEAAQRRETELNQNLKKAGVDLFAISTKEDLVNAILRMVAMRKKRRM
ncbi:MAG: DUF58 domain-containing protein [Anaerolineales bacterium]